MSGRLERGRQPAMGAASPGTPPNGDHRTLGGEGEMYTWPRQRGGGGGSRGDGVVMVVQVVIFL